MSPHATISWNFVMTIAASLPATKMNFSQYYQLSQYNNTEAFFKCLSIVYPTIPPGATYGEDRGILLSFERKTCPKSGEFDLVLDSTP